MWMIGARGVDLRLWSEVYALPPRPRLPLPLPIYPPSRILEPRPLPLVRSLHPPGPVCCTPALQLLSQRMPLPSL